VPCVLPTVETNQKVVPVNQRFKQWYYVPAGCALFGSAVVGYIWYKKYRRKNVDLNMRNEKLNLN
jgi:uncharacterized integral membrane protein